MRLSEGEKAPDFDVPADGAGRASLKAAAGKTVVLYFYPKDDTPGCTKEACGFRQLIDDFDAAGAVIIGVSKDSVKKHDKFKAKYELPFTLASDEAGEICEAFGSRRACMAGLIWGSSARPS